MITGLKYERGYLEWGIAYIFPSKGQRTLRFNLNSPSFREERRHWWFYIGDISHEEIHCDIWKLTKSKKVVDAYDTIQKNYIDRVPKRIPYVKRLSYNGFLTEKALNNMKRLAKKRRRHR